jgi:hypothetical protein
MENPVMHFPDKINIKFLNGCPFVEIIDKINKKYRVHFIDKKNKKYRVHFIDKKNNDVLYNVDINSNNWASCTKEGNIEWIIKIWGMTDYYYLEYDLNSYDKRRYQRMVVIATHNGSLVLKNLLQDIKSFNISNDEVCVVDNKSTDNSYIEYLNELKKEGYKILFNPSASYQPGAYKLAVETFKSDVWYFFMDSIRIKQNIFETIEPKLTDTNAYTLLTFDWPDHVFQNVIYEFLYKYYQTVTYKTGIVGNIFFAKDKVIQKVIKDWGMPDNKLENTAMEIGFGLAFDKNNIEIIGLDVSDERVDAYNGFTVYPFFDKIAMYKYRQ